MTRIMPVVLLALSLWACGPSARAPEAVWAQTVERLRQSSEQWLAERDLERAESDLRRIFLLEMPSDVAGADQLLQDAHFALGSLLLLKRRPDEAISEANAGLGRSDEATIFRANLLALRALAIEAKGRPLDALEDYSAALEIHKACFDEALASYEKEDAP